ncbi:MAG TPA: DUF6584 family protein, partial [Ktedonobacterales bacterium]
MAQTARMALSESLRRVEAEIAAGHPDLALVRCQELQTLYPRALAVHRVLGEIYLSLRKPREALGALDRALGGDPEDARACCARAIVHQMHGDSLAALAWYRRACDIRPDDTVLRATYAELAAPLGQPPYRPTPVGLARLYLRGGLYPHAIREWEMLSAEYPDLLEAQVGLAETLWRAQRLEATTERCKRILANAPSCVKAMLLLAVMAHDANNHAEAQRLIQRAAEYDPDQRIAQALFADRLAAGDLALRTLILGDDRPPVSYPLRTGQLNDSTARRNLSRPLARPQTGQLGAAPARDGNGTLSPPARPQPLTAMPARPSGLPPEFHSIFSEAENMIWEPEENERGAPAPTPAAPMASPPSPPGDHAPQSQPLVPPAIAAQGANMDETEVRQAVNWVHWLQAQGARVHAGAQMPRPPRVEAPNAPHAPATGPLPPPTPEALRSMFAELAPEGSASGHGVVEADVISSASERPAPAPGASGVDAWAGSGQDVAQPSWSRPFDQEAASGTGEAAGASSPVWAEGGVPAAGPASQPDTTLEALQRQYATSGFEEFEPRPGALAELADEHARTDQPARPEEPLPAPDDYAGRLERARRLRAEGRTDEAL